MQSLVSWSMLLYSVCCQRGLPTALECFKEWSLASGLNVEGINGSLSCSSMLIISHLHCLECYWSPLSLCCFGHCSISVGGYSQTSTPPSPSTSSLNLSIKSERASPEHISSPTTPPPHHIGARSPITGHPPQEAHSAMGRDGNYPSPHLVARSLSEEKGDPPLRQIESNGGWQR